MSRTHTVIATGAAVVALAGIVGLGAAGSGALQAADAASGDAATKTEVKITQRISSAAVRRSNANRGAIAELRSLMKGGGIAGTPGGDGQSGRQGPAGPQGPQGPPGPSVPLPGGSVDTQAIADDAVTSAKLAPASVEGPALSQQVRDRIPRWANVDGVGGVKLEGGGGAISAQREVGTAVGDGRYRVVFDRPLTEQTCSVSVSIHNTSDTLAHTAQHSYLDGQLRVQIFDEAGVKDDQDFSVQVSC